jgi:hypothetical protein
VLVLESKGSRSEDCLRQGRCGDGSDAGDGDGISGGVVREGVRGVVTRLHTDVPRAG